MQFMSTLQRVTRWLVLGALLSCGLAMAQAEPTMNDIYATAQAGKLDEAQKMITHVLMGHPNSAKAHFVQSELFARQGNLGKAKDALAAADKLAPGLPFAKPEAVQALRTQLSAKSTATAPVNSTTGLDGASQRLSPATAPAPSSSSWQLPLLLAVIAIAGGYFIFRKRAPVQDFRQPAYANANPAGMNDMNSMNGLNGPQTFGNAASTYPAPVQPAGSGLGGKIMGGVATGLAVGAGVMAAEAIGRNLMGGNHGQPALSPDNRTGNDYQPSTTNTDMGGQNFGINDASSWDDGGSGDAGGGSDWDT